VCKQLQPKTKTKTKNIELHRLYECTGFKDRALLPSSVNYEGHIGWLVKRNCGIFDLKSYLNKGGGGGVV